ncbi:SCAN domain-containing protein 3-like [Paramisgurnus dabryanus]|uniref:SCAN domain-containing protein 3-like n=1 Tax=Paramisgurnus dabryanus TaxID=90735 RepID=UPI0031F34ED7
MTRVFELREELQKFLSDKQSPLATHFSYKSWLAKQAYLSDIFMTLNDLNLTMQGRMADTFRLADKIAGFKAKLKTWARRINRVVFDMFSNLSSFSKDAEGLGLLKHCHLTSLSDEFERYFPSEKDPRNGKEWMRNPFQDYDGQNQLSSRQEDQLLELRNDGGLKTVFISTPLTSFWIKASKEYTEISTLALKTLLPFPTSYLCEAGFSAMTSTKTRLRNRLDVRNTLHVSLSTIKPRYDVFVAAKQSQGSH